MSDREPANRVSGQFWSLLQSLEPLFALVLVTVGFAVADNVWGEGHFSEMRNFRVVLVQAAPVAVAALGMTLIIIAGGIDLSAGTASMLCATVLACLLRSEYSIGLAVLATLIPSTACDVAMFGPGAWLSARRATRVILHTGGTDSDPVVAEPPSRGPNCNACSAICGCSCGSRGVLSPIGQRMKGRSL